MIRVLKNESLAVFLYNMITSCYALISRNLVYYFLEQIIESLVILIFFTQLFTFENFTFPVDFNVEIESKF